MTDESFREKLRKALKGKQECIERFLSICYYQPGQYDSNEDFAKLDERLNMKENSQCTLYADASGHYVCKKNRLFYFAIPPSQFQCVSKCLHGKLLGHQPDF